MSFERALSYGDGREDEDVRMADCDQTLESEGGLVVLTAVSPEG